MRKRSQTVAGASIRPINPIWLYTARYRKIVMPVLLSLVLVAAGFFGYLLGQSKPVQATVIDDGASIAAFEETLAAQENACKAIEMANVLNALETEKTKNENLSGALSSKENELSTVEDNILNALMSNLNNNVISRAGNSVSDYASQARKLISLNNKLQAFKKTAAAKKVDLTNYEAKITRRLNYLPTLKPTTGVLKGYGNRIHPVFGYFHFHPGDDITTDQGTPIKAAGAGTVMLAEYSSTAGNYIKINHGNGFTTVYMHCSKLRVSVGQTVTKGQLIGNVGSTGTSTGPHLHFEIRLYGEPVNPTSMIMQS
jgi:murein DD-endopeptidase MepM/ murein hydrolase activator NlpD